MRGCFFLLQFVLGPSPNTPHEMVVVEKDRVLDCGEGGLDEVDEALDAQIRGLVERQEADALKGVQQINAGHIHRAQKLREKHLQLLHQRRRRVSLQSAGHAPIEQLEEWGWGGGEEGRGFEFCA